MLVDHSVAGCRKTLGDICRKEDDVPGARRGDLLDTFPTSHTPDGRSLTDLEVHDQIMSFLAAGTETTARALAGPSATSPRTGRSRRRCTPKWTSLNGPGLRGSVATAQPYEPGARALGAADGDLGPQRVASSRTSPRGGPF
ncbi:hypothetical protein ACWGJ2_19690 [Streptomyces sp. NPDC054796]